MRQRDEIGDRTSADRHSQPFSILDAAKDCADIVAELSGGDFGHSTNVAELLQSAALVRLHYNARSSRAATSR